MVAFTDKKQGLHDKIADTVVIFDPTRKRRPWIVFLSVMWPKIPANSFKTIREKTGNHVYVISSFLYCILSGIVSLRAKFTKRGENVII